MMHSDRRSWSSPFLSEIPCVESVVLFIVTWKRPIEGFGSGGGFPSGFVSRRGAGLSKFAFNRTRSFIITTLLGLAEGKSCQIFYFTLIEVFCKKSILTCALFFDSFLSRWLRCACVLIFPCLFTPFVAPLRVLPPYLSAAFTIGGPDRRAPDPPHKQFRSLPKFFCLTDFY